MMDSFVSKKGATKVLFHNSTVGKDADFIFGNLKIAVFAITTRAIGAFNAVNTIISVFTKIVCPTKTFCSFGFIGTFVNCTFHAPMITVGRIYVKA